MQNRLLVVGMALLCFYLSYTALNTDVGSDPKLTLLVSQAVVDQGTVQLDAYVNDTILNEPFHTLVQSRYVVAHNDHYFNYYPIGPSLISAPFVALARLSGLDMREADNYALQRMLAALTTAVVFVLIYYLVRCYLGTAEAIIISVISVLGSSLISTLGTALWSHNYTVIFSTFVLLLLVRRENGRSHSYHPLWLGLLLFLTFLCRAASAAFILPVLLYLLWRDWRAAVVAGAVSLIGLLAFLGWSAGQTGQILPEYYKAGRFAADREPAWVGVLGNLISPSRGIFIFSPFLIPVFAGLLLRGRTLFRRPLIWLCLLWFGLTLILVARAASWWGGWSFGPRILTDLWPGLVLLTAQVWREVKRRPTADRRPPMEKRRQRSAVSGRSSVVIPAAYCFLGIAAIFLHVGLGLNSQVASRWNGSIEPRPHPGDPTLGDLFNWRYAQPLANNGMLCALGARWFERAAAEYGLPLVAYSPGQLIHYDADQIVPWPVRASESNSLPRSNLPENALAARSMLPLVARPGNLAAFQGWGNPYEAARWSQCRESQIYLYLGNLRVEGADAALTLTAAAHGPQEIEVAINGQPIGSFYRSHAQQTTTLPFAASLLRPNAFNVIHFHFPDARYPNLYDQRPLGIQFRRLLITVNQ